MDKTQQDATGPWFIKRGVCLLPTEISYISYSLYSPHIIVYNTLTHSNPAATLAMDDKVTPKSVSEVDIESQDNGTALKPRLVSTDCFNL